MSYNMYLLMGLFNCILVIIVLVRTMMEKNKLMDCKLFSRLLITVLLVDIVDTAGWMLDGKLTGNLRIITSIIDGLNLFFTAFVCYNWVEYVRYLAYDDVGIKSNKNYFSIVLFTTQIVLVITAIPTDLLYYIDYSGIYNRGTGYEFFLALCIVQLLYAIGICIWACKKQEAIEKKRELCLVGLVILLPIFGTLIQGLFYGISMIWTCMTILIVLIYIHIQDKRIIRDNSIQNNKLTEALEKAQYTSKAKSEFLSNMSHDIRTPMNAILGFTDIASRHIDEKDIVEDSLDKIVVSSKQLLSLINEVLDMSRIESGKMKVHIIPCNLPNITHDLVDMIQSQIIEHNLKLYVNTINVYDEEILTDIMKFNQIFVNLVSNAIKFNKQNGSIYITIEQKKSDDLEKGHYIFTVKDTGIGIAAESIEHIFEPFERAVKADYMDSIEGTGLGLAIVKSNVDMLGGTISVKSELGVGTEFIVELSFPFPIRANSLTNIIDKRYTEHKALIVDEFDSCNSIRDLLQKLGVEADYSTSLDDAILKVKNTYEHNDCYSLFIINWLIPDSNGIEIVRQINNIIGDNYPLIIMTAYDWSDIEGEAKSAGVSLFFKKPLFISDLKKCLNPFSKITTNHKNEENYNNVDFIDKRILIAEDQPLNRLIIERLLVDKCIIAESAENGLIALNKFKNSIQGYYDLILMDIRMPEMDGYQASDAIRLLDRQDAKDIPIIALTANAFDEDRKNALEHGMNTYLTKPINVEELYRTLDMFFSKKH